MSDGLLNYKEVATKLRVCPRQARRVCKRIGLKPLDLGHRTKLFRPADVDRALAKLAGETTSRRAPSYG